MCQDNAQAHFVEQIYFDVMAELDLAALNVSTHESLALALLGGTVEGINDRGVIATANIPPHTVIASIPLTSTISSSALLANVEEVRTREATSNDVDEEPIFTKPHHARRSFQP